jgi:hypothetical protein
VDEYFRLRSSNNQRFAEVHNPDDAQGEPFPMFKPVPPGVRGTCRCVDRRTRLAGADCIYCVTDLIISERAASVFKRANLAEGTTFLPVDVVARDGKHLGTMVCVMFPELILNIVDLEASKYKNFSNGRPWYFTEPPVVHGAALGGFDLLFADWVLYVCSGRLKREIEKEGLTGFTFEQMVVK